MNDTLFTQDEISPNLPPAGHERREELARREDNLQQMAEELSEDRGTIPESALEPDHNIQSEIRRGFLDVDLGPNYVTKWVNYVNRNAFAVWEAKKDGWKTVTADIVKDVDRDLVREDNTLRVADVICMYIRIDQHMINQRKAEDRALRRQYGIEGELDELARKNPRALKVHNAIEGKYGDTIQKRAARRTAMQHIGNKMKQGTVPGIPLK